MDDINKCNNLLYKKSKKNSNEYYLMKEKYSKQNKRMSISKDLIEFISNINKFNFNSAFDHKGTKSFLNSKKKALEEIKIDENIIYEEENTENEKKQSKVSKDNTKSCKGITNKSNKNTQISPRKKIILSNIKKCTQSPKKHRKVRPNIKYSSHNHLLKVIDNKLKLKKENTKFCSEIELRMYQDKDLNKIHPIKTFEEKKNGKYKNTNDLADSFHRKRNTVKSNSTLIDIENEISHNNIEI